MRLSTDKKYIGAFSKKADVYRLYDPDIFHPLLVEYGEALEAAKQYKGVSIRNLDAHKANYRMMKAKEAWEAARCPIFKNEK